MEKKKKKHISLALLAAFRAKRDGAMTLQTQYHEVCATLGDDLAKYFYMNLSIRPSENTISFINNIPKHVINFAMRFMR